MIRKLLILKNERSLKPEIIFEGGSYCILLTARIVELLCRNYMKEQDKA
jgi:hypothetical protein